MVDKIIKDIDKLLEQKLGKTKKLVKCEIKNVTIPGENYNGVISRVDLTLREFGKDKQLHCVAKAPKLNVNELFLKHIPVIYGKEIGFYRDIVPTYENFFIDHGIGEFPDIFPKMYAGRLNLTGDPGLVDENAVILMENLIEEGFSHLDRHVGFDLEAAKLFLKDLATFHAVPIAIKIKKSHIFDIKIRKLCDLTTDVKPLPNAREIQIMIVNGWLDVLKHFDIPCQYLKCLDRVGAIPLSNTREPFATLIHCDLWTNNTMQFIKNGKVLKNKIIDFQIYCYGSPARDVLVFLSSSLQFELLEDHFDELIKFYHQHFKQTLEKCNCYTSEFDWSNFKKEIDIEAANEIGHIIFLTPVVYGAKGQSVVEDEKKVFDFVPDRISELARKRVAKLINLFGERGWL